MVRMVVESISCPMPTICDQVVAQTYNPGIEVRFKKQQQQKKKTKTKKQKKKKKKKKKNRRNTESALLQVNCTMTVCPL